MNQQTIYEIKDLIAGSLPITYLIGVSVLLYPVVTMGSFEHAFSTLFVAGLFGILVFTISGLWTKEIKEMRKEVQK